MTREQFEREKNYQAAFTIARAMHRQGMIDDGDLDKLEEAFRAKFCPPIGARIGREPLIFGRVKGNLSPGKEGVE